MALFTGLAGKTRGLPWACQALAGGLPGNVCTFHYIRSTWCRGVPAKPLFFPSKNGLFYTVNCQILFGTAEGTLPCSTECNNAKLFNLMLRSTQNLNFRSIL